MINPIDFMVAEERARDDQRWLEQERLARQVPTTPSGLAHSGRWLLNRFGQWLEGWGRDLQERAAPPAALPVRR
jgi:hypothetical protein